MDTGVGAWPLQLCETVDLVQLRYQRNGVPKLVWLFVDVETERIVGGDSFARFVYGRYPSAAIKILERRYGVTVTALRYSQQQLLNGDVCVPQGLDALFSPNEYAEQVAAASAACMSDADDVCSSDLIAAYC